MYKSTAPVKIVGGTSSVGAYTIQAAGSSSELVNCVPIFILIKFTPVLYPTHSTRIKILSVCASINTLTTHKYKGTYPPEIAGTTRVPTCQFSKETREATSVQADLITEYEKILHTAREDYLIAPIAGKWIELKLPESLVTCVVLVQEITDPMKPTMDKLASDLQISAVREDDGGWKVTSGPAPMNSEMNFCMNNMTALFDHCVILAQNSKDREWATHRAVAKMAKHCVEDIIMGDGDDSSRATQDIINSALKKFAGKYQLKAGGSSKSNATTFSMGQTVPRLTYAPRTRSVQSAEESQTSQVKQERQETAGFKGEGQGYRRKRQGRYWEAGEKEKQWEECQKMECLGMSLRPCSKDATFHFCEDPGAWPKVPRAWLYTVMRNADLFLTVSKTTLRNYIQSHLLVRHCRFRH